MPRLMPRLKTRVKTMGPIKKPPCGQVVPNLGDYDKARAEFSWDVARRELEGLPNQRGLNMAHEAVDRHAAGPDWDRVAIRWLGKSGRVEDLTYRQLAG
jgi:acetyl-CoA synthetase